MSQGYSAPMLESRDTSKAELPRSFSFAFSDDRRNLPDNDTSNYVLEIEPVNGNFDCTAAICTQYTDVGTPTIYTSWLVPENGKTQSVMQILSRNNFMRGQEVIDAYEHGQTLTMRKVEIADQPVFPSWQMTDDQRKLLGQFLALYWMSLVQNQPSLGKAGKRLYLVLKEPGATELMRNEEAVEFFNKEIVSRLPLEAQNMISAVFGVKNSEADKNFRKAVCVILSSQIGLAPDKKIDLFKGTQDILKKIPSREDREAMKVIAECLIGGEKNYPKWYLILRQKLKKGIPQTSAPLLMYICHVLQALESGDIKPTNPLLYYEQCYKTIYTKLVEGAVNEQEAHSVLEPLLKEIIGLWCTIPLSQADAMEFYRSKRNWLTNEVQIQSNQVNKYVSGLADKVFDDIKTSKVIALPEKIKICVEMLLQFSIEQHEGESVRKSLECFLSENFEEWLFSESDETLPEELPLDCFTRVLGNWNSSGLHRQPDEVKDRLSTVLDQYKGISVSVTNAAMFSVDKLCLKALIKKCKEADQRSEQLSSEQLDTLAKQIHTVGTDPSARDIASIAMDILRRNYHTWSCQKPVIVPEDERFLELAKIWLSQDLKTVEDFSSTDIEKLQKNISIVLSDYSVDSDEQDHHLLNLRRKIGITKLKEIEQDVSIDDSVKALKIAGVHQTFARKGNVLQENDELSKQIDNAILEHFLDWNKAEKPFASSMDLQYHDKWFVPIAETWLKERLKDYILDFNADELQTLEANIKSAFDAYRISEEQKNRALLQIRLAKFQAQMNEIVNDNSIELSDKALKLASIHSALKKICPNDAKDLEKKLEDAILPVYYNWSNTEKPFISNDDQRYDDDWFIEVTQKWIQSEADQLSLNADEIEHLDKNISSVLSLYKVPKDDQSSLLCELRKKWVVTGLDELYYHESNDPQKALSIANIHNIARQFPGVLTAGEDIDQKLKDAMCECFLAWEQCEKPFISGESGRYEDDWFVVVANSWIQNHLNEAMLESDQMEQLEKHLVEVYGYYKRSHEQQRNDLLPLRLAWCRAKLENVLQSKGNIISPEDALCIAGIHNTLLKQIGTGSELVLELEKDLQSALRESFVAWSKAEKPFSSSLDLKYEDGKFFETVARDWLAFDMRNANLDSSEMESIEEKLKGVFGIYKIYRDEQNQMMTDLRRVWGSAKIRDVQLSSLDRTTQALSIAGIHNKLRQLKDVLDEDLSHELETAMLELFLDWEKADKPFSSSQQQRYEDDWFVTVATHWLQNDSCTSSMEDTEIAKLEEDFIKVFNTYHITREKQNNMLRALRINMYKAKLSAIQQNMQNNDSSQALKIASIHNAYRQIATGTEDDTKAFEREIDNALRECFVAWSQADKPFASNSQLRYDDDFFVTVASDWLNFDLPDENLPSEVLEILSGKIKNVLGTYKVSRENQNALLLPLYRKLAKTKLEDALSDFSLAPQERAIRIADAHHKLRMIADAIVYGDDLDNLFQDRMLDYFVEWSHTQKPFASSLDWRYDDNWFESILQKWCAERMEGTDLDSEAFSLLGEKIEEAARNYHLHNWDTIKKLIREKNAEICISEESRMSNPSENAICKIAEMIFRGDIAPQNHDLYEKGLSIVADNFDKWAMTEPAFHMPNNSIAAYQLTGKNVFLEMLRSWRNNHLVSGNVDLRNADELKDRIQKACSVCRISQKEYEKELQLLELIIYRQEFESVHDQPITPQVVVAMAGIRKKLDDMKNPERTMDLQSNVTDFLKENMILWLSAEQPLSAEKIGYKDPSVPEIVEDWIKNEMVRHTWSVDELRNVRNSFIQVSKQYRMFSGRQISMEAIQSIDVLECEAFIQGLPAGPVSSDDLKILAGWLESLPTDEEDTISKIKMCLTQNFIAWSDCQPPFSADGKSVQQENFIRIASDWSKKYLPIITLSSADWNTIKKKLSEVRLSRISEEMTEILAAIEVRRIEQRLHELQDTSAALSVQAVTELAGIYDQSLRNDGLSNIRDSAKNELVKNYITWGIANKFMIPSENASPLSAIPLDDITVSWLYLQSIDSLKNVDIRSLRENLESASHGAFHLDSAKLDSLERKLYSLQIDQMTLSIKRCNSEDLSMQLISGMRLYYDVSIKYGDAIGQINDLKTVLMDNYEKIAFSSERMTNEDGFAELTKVWLDCYLPKKHFKDLAQIRDLQTAIEEKYTQIATDISQVNKVKSALEICWMNEAISFSGMISVSVAEIAGTEARLSSYGTTMQQSDKEKLYCFLNEQFIRWSQDGFHSGEDSESYTLKEFPQIAQKWLAQTDLTVYTVEKLDRLSEKLGRALSSGYDMDMDTVNAIIKPIDEAKRTVLFKLAVSCPTEENMDLLRDLYLEDPTQYYSPIFQVYENVAKEGNATIQIAEFVAVQKQVWCDNKDLNLRYAIIHFLDNIWGVYGSQRPETLQETMETILSTEHFHLPVDISNLHHWAECRNRLLERAINKLLKKVEDPESMNSEWDTKQYEKYGMKWTDLTIFPFFKKALAEWFESNWQKSRNIEDEHEFISTLYEISKNSSSTDYCHILAELLFTYIQKAYEEISVKRTWQDEIDEMLQFVNSQGISISSIQNSQKYIAGIYRRGYEKLLAAWNQREAVLMLQGRLNLPADMRMQLSIPKFEKSKQWMLLMLLHEAPFDSTGGYWDIILQKLNTPKLSLLDTKELKEIGETSFMANLQWCYDNLPGGSNSWLANDLKNCLKTLAPNMWKGMHQGIFSSGIKKLVKDGWRGLPEKFSDWLRNN